MRKEEERKEIVMSTNIVPALAEAITKQEGFFPGSVAYRNNNPGNIMDLDYYKQTGSFRVKSFATLEEGTKALYSLIEKYIGQGHTLLSFFAKYAPGGHGANDPNQYAKNVSQWTGLPLDVPLNTIGAGAGTTVEEQGQPQGGEGPEVGASLLPLVAGVGILGLAVWWLF